MPIVDSHILHTLLLAAHSVHFEDIYHGSVHELSASPLEELDGLVSHPLLVRVAFPLL